MIKNVFHRIFLFLMQVSMLVIISLFTSDLPGDNDTIPDPDDHNLKTRRDLEHEFGDQLSGSIYRTFQIAVFFHGLKLHGRAKHYYNKLCHIRLSDGTVYNLAKHSRVLRHNLSLLK